MAKDKNARRLRIVRHIRVRKKVHGNLERPRLCVFRSLRQIYAQVIDDNTGHTLASASSLEAAAGKGSETSNKLATSKSVGKLVYSLPTRDARNAKRLRSIQRARICCTSS